ncbi:MAG: Na/Pi cotransporter family protein [Alphaproteobacteria bacterium]|nr:MAG: Na/Pi cotransporter family protein [Alphaproteobacteria bacterium]
MIAQFVTLAGGVGLFLIGLGLMTEAMRAAIGARAHDLLERVSARRLPALGAGFGLAGLMQSSTATSVIALGLVGAGLLEFRHAVPVLFGANLGSLVNGWLVALLGFRGGLLLLAPVLVLLGALAGIYGRGTLARWGRGLSGLGLLFMGLAAMRSALPGLIEDAVLPGAGGLTGRLELAAIGLGATLVTQSANATIAGAMVMLAAGSVDLAQAAHLMLGAELGKTSPALIAGFAGSARMRRAGLAHAGYNLVLVTLGFLVVLPLAVAPLEALMPALGAPVTLMLLRTLAQIVTVAVLLPLSDRFAALLVRLSPAPAGLDAALDPALVRDAEAGTRAAHVTARRLSAEMFGALAAALAPRPDMTALETLPDRIDEPLEELGRFLQRLRPREDQPEAAQRLVALFHALDHLERLYKRCRQIERIRNARALPEFRRELLALGNVLADAAEDARAAPAGGPRPALLIRLERITRRARRRASRLRDEVLASAGAAGAQAELLRSRLLALTDAIRWGARTAERSHRIVRYLALSAPGGAEPVPEEPEEFDY